MIPVSPDQFFAVFRDYNEAIWPGQIVLVIVALLAVIAAVAGEHVPMLRRDAARTGLPSMGPVPAVRHTADSDRLAGFALTGLWAWTGVVYFMTFFAPVNPVAWLFGLLFLTQAVLFAHTTWRGRLHFRVKLDAWGIVGGAFAIYALVIYPAIAKLSGHGYPQAPTFGAPCPTTIFTFAMLLWVGGRMPRRLLVIPFIWSIVGTFAVWSFGVIGDVGLGVAGIAGTVMIVARNRRLTRAARRPVDGPGHRTSPPMIATH